MKSRYALMMILMVAFGIILSACQSKEVTSAKVYLQQDNFDAAIEQLEQAIELYPEDPEAHYWLGFCYAEKGNYDGMNAMFDKADKLSDVHDQDIKKIREKAWVDTFNKGVNQLNNDNVEGAIESFETCISIDASRSEAFRTLGIAYTADGQPEKAKEAFKNVLDIEPENKDAIQALASLYFDDKEYE